MNKEALDAYISSIQALIDNAFKEHDVAVFENPTNLGKEDLVDHLVRSCGKTLFVSQSYDINRQWNEHPDVVKNAVFITYNQLSAISCDDIYDFCTPYALIILDEAHHAGAKGYIPNIARIINNDDRTAKVFGMTTHTKRYSDAAEDVAYTVFGGHKIAGISFEEAIKKELLPQFDYISALYSLPRDIDDLVASSSLAKKIISDSKLVQVNEEGIKEIIRKHMPEGNRKVVYFVPTIEDSVDAEKMALELGYGPVYAINYTKGDKYNRDALEAYNEADEASLVCISKFNEGAIPKGTNTVVVLRRTATINIFERQVLTALFTATEKPVVYDFVSNIDNLIYSKKDSDGQSRSYYAERVKSLCSQSIVIDYARQWTTVFNKLRSLNPGGWTPQQDELLRLYYPKYGNEIYRYIKGHNLKECILRAEMLGIEGPKKPSEPVYEKKERDKPYIIKMDIPQKEDDYPGLSSKSMIRLARVYAQYLDIGRIDNKLVRKTVLADTASKVSLLKYVNTLIENTQIVKPECEKNIKNRQGFFREFMEDYAGYNSKKTSSVVILDGKALTKGVTKEVIDKHIAEKKFELKKDSMVLVGDRYMKKNKAIAGLMGETVLEHMLHKAYFKILMEGYNPDRLAIAPFVKEYAAEEVEAKISALRSTQNAWSKEDENFIRTAGNNPEKLYKTLIREHSDADIYKKAKEIGNAGFFAFCQKRELTFDKGYQEFLADFKRAKELEAAKKKKTWESQQRAEENKKKKEADKARLKTLKPTVVLVSKKKVK